MASNNSSQNDTCYSENRRDIELPTKENQEGEGVPHPERNDSSVLNYQGHSYDPVTIKDEKRHPLIDKIGL